MTLSSADARWYDAICAEFELECQDLRILQLACEGWDRCQAARVEIEKYGLTCKDRFGQPTVRPEVKIEFDNRTSFARMMRELALDADPPPETPRPPTLGSQH